LEGQGDQPISPEHGGGRRRGGGVPKDILKKVFGSAMPSVY